MPLVQLSHSLLRRKELVELKDDNAGEVTGCIDGRCIQSHGIGGLGSRQKWACDIQSTEAFLSDGSTHIRSVSEASDPWQQS